MTPLRLGLAAMLCALAASPAVADEPAASPLAKSTPDQVRAELGEPAVASEEGKGALWTYRLQGCALMVFFKDEGRGLRVVGVSAGPRRRGDAVPDANACLAANHGGAKP